MDIAAAKVFSQVILAEKTVRIKLLGDSITHGVGGTRFAQNGEPITEGFARNPDGHCWANLFKTHLESQYDCTVINNACTGTNIEFVIAHFDELVDADDDIVICVIGTNNRHQHFWDGPKRDRRVHMEMFIATFLHCMKSSPQQVRRLSLQRIFQPRSQMKKTAVITGGLCI